jgi:hypothetical protein
MADCELLKTCIFFNDKMNNMPSTAELVKMRYCRGNNKDCARYMIFSTRGRAYVPETLFPNEAETARSIIATS